MIPRKFKTFADFYPYYLSEHRTPSCRRLHFFGTCLVLILLTLCLLLKKPWILALVPLTGYGMAWIGHFYFEKNTPATYSHPFYSLAGDGKMFWDILSGKIKL